MQFEDPASAIGKDVKDIYGRDLGRCIGYTVDLSGNLRTIGVELGTAFQEYPADRISLASDDEGIVTMPEWKADSRRVGMEKGILDKRLGALTKMLEAGEISQRVYDEMHKGLMAIRVTHEQLSRELVKRLDSLEDSDDTINAFLAKVKLQGVSEELTERAVKWTADFCVAMKSMNERERIDINEILDMVTAESASPMEPIPSSDQSGNEEPIGQAGVHSEPEVEAEAPPERTPGLGSSRSFGSSEE
ncbi:MAG: CdvA-like protein [Thaumarchaeota archaeon]|nr:CdvA-like protein [Nitrososphaerota archaeon]